MEEKDDSWREAIVNLVVKVSCVLHSPNISIPFGF
jgi:hypothetical protein